MPLRQPPDSQPGPSGGGALPAAWSLEDWAVLRGALLEGAPRGLLLLPCGPGDDALDLLAMGAPEVLAVAPDAGSLALAELKLAAARTFPVWNLRSLLGLDAFGRRVYLYHYIRDRKVEGRGPPPPELSPRARGWWDAHEADIRTGLAEAGGQEQALAGFRRHLGRMGIAARVGRAVDGAVALEGRRWRLACRLGLTGVVPGVSASQLRGRLEALATGGGGPGLRRVLTGEGGGPEDDHPYLRTAGHAVLADRSTVLHLHQGTLVSALAERPAGSLAGVFLGHALDRGEPGSGAALLGAAARALQPGGRLLLRGARGADPAAALRQAVAAEDALVIEPERTETLDRQDRHPLSRAVVVATRRP